jgi:hypothetical protein
MVTTDRYIRLRVHILKTWSVRVYIENISANIITKKKT